MSREKFWSQEETALQSLHGLGQVFQMNGGQWPAEVPPHCISFISVSYRIWASLVAQRLKRLPPMQETEVQSLGGEDPLKKEMVTHSSILAGESHGRRSLVGYSPQGCKESDTTERLQFHFSPFLWNSSFWNSTTPLKYLNLTLLCTKKGMG